MRSHGVSCLNAPTRVQVPCSRSTALAVSAGDPNPTIEEHTISDIQCRRRPENDSLRSPSFDPSRAKLIRELFCTPEDSIRVVIDVRDGDSPLAFPWLRIPRYSPS